LCFIALYYVNEFIELFGKYAPTARRLE